jgi:hypothetical protein
MKPIDLLFAIPVMITAVAIYMKAYYNIRLYNTREGTNIGLIQYMQTLRSMNVFYPIFTKSIDEKEEELIRKANRWIYLFYSMLIIVSIEVIFVGKRSELF